MRFWVGLMLFILTGCASARSSDLALVRVPVADLRSTPAARAQGGSIHDDAQESQLLFGEHVRILEQRGGWARVAALEQAEFSHNSRWEGYPGWVPLSVLSPVRAFPKPSLVVVHSWARAWQDAALSKPHSLRLPIGTQLTAVSSTTRAWGVRTPDGSVVWLDRDAAHMLAKQASLTPEERRSTIMDAAKTFIGMQYLWGGRSPHLASVPTTGVDCSSLVGLAYRTAGMQLPRDAHEQAMRARPVKSPQPADLIFLSAKNNPRRIVHVMLVDKGDDLIEAPGTGLAVRRISSRERLGAALAQIKPGSTVDGQTVTFGSYLPDSSRSGS